MRPIKKVSALYLLAVAAFSLHAQQMTLPGMGEAEREPALRYPPEAVLPIRALPEVEGNLPLAISERNYPVTPGDVYTLTFLLAGETVSNTLLVESDYTINMTIFGKLNAREMTFAQLKPVIEKIIADAYPRSLPSVTITTVGVFQVALRGEIPESRYVTAWGLSRLSEVLEDNLGPYSSVRDVEIISETGQSRRYDLLAALNQGDLSQNPRIRPEDTIVVSRARRAVTIRGEVYTPGVYQLLDREGMEEALRFSRGSTARANLSRIRVDRFAADGRTRTFFLNYNDPAEREGFEFRNDDIMTIPTSLRTQPVVFVEGGISVREEPGIITTYAAVPDPLREDATRISHPLSEGETLFDILDNLRESFTPYADLANSHIIRGDDLIPVNMLDLLYRADMSHDMFLEPLDRITIPIRRPVIYVTGAANIPGRFPYIAQEDYLHYIGLAGGFDQLRNRSNRVIVTDRDGNRRAPSSPLQPGDTVNVLSNDFLYNFNRYFPAIATGLGMILTIIAITNALNQGGAD